MNAHYFKLFGFGVPGVGNGTKTRAGSEGGMVYLVILFLLAILSTLGVTFLETTHTGVTVTASREEGMQAQYLAESATNHAMWRLLHEENFPASETVYYMHSFAGGRYGYKVRRHTRATFATVATIGAVGNSVARQSYVLYIKTPMYGTLTVYGDSSHKPKYRTFDNPDWSPEADTVDVSANTRWVELSAKASEPEVIMGTLDEDNDINLAVWDGESWGNPMEFTSNAYGSYKCFDIAHESLSGDALVVGRIGTGPDPYYTIWDGSSWVHDPPLPVASSSSGYIHYIRTEPNPQSDEILVTVLGDRLALLRWDGTQFIDMGVLSTTPSTVDYPMVEMGYEHSSGEAMIIYGESGFYSKDLRYRTWNGSTLSAEGTIRQTYEPVRVIRAASDPTSDYIIAVTLDEGNDLYVDIWNGSSWTDGARVETSAYVNDRQCFDATWKGSGDAALVVWGRNYSTYLHYICWQKDTPFSSTPIQTGPQFGGFLSGYISLVRAQGLYGTDQIIVLGGNSDKDLKYTLWDGDAFVHNPAKTLHNDLFSTAYMGFDVVQAGYKGGESPTPPGETIILEAHFDTDEDGFVYEDDTFRGTHEPYYGSGTRIGSGGYSGGGLKVSLGDTNAYYILDMSGGWKQSFTLSETGEVTLSFRYDLTLSSEYESDEYSQVLASVDGTLYGEWSNDYVCQINGNGNGGVPDTSGWQIFRKNLGTLSAGIHELVIGGYNNKKTYDDEYTDVLIDDVTVTR